MDTDVHHLCVAIWGQLIGLNHTSKQRAPKEALACWLPLAISLRQEVPGGIELRPLYGGSSGDDK